MTLNLPVLSHLVKQLDENAAIVMLWKYCKHESLSSRIKSADAFWIINSLKGTKELQIGKVIHMDLIFHHSDNLVIAHPHC